MSSNNAPNIASLFATAAATGQLTTAGAAVVTPNMAANITAALGVGVDDLEASNVTMANFLIDDSSSIKSVRGNREAVRDGANGVIDAVLDAKNAEEVIATMTFLNKGLLYGFQSVTNVPRLNDSNYDPSGYTPLYDNIAQSVGLVVAKAAEFMQKGVPARSVTMIVTDGADVGSTQHRTPESLRPLIERAVKSEQHVILAMGIDDGTTDFRGVFTRMGLNPDHILTPKNSPSEIRRAFMMFSKSMARASVAAGTSLAAAVGSFASP